MELLKNGGRFTTLGKVPVPSDHKSLDHKSLEAAYFLTLDGKRTGLLILNLEDASQIAEFCEPWFLALHAEAYWSPVMVPSDLQRAAPAIEEAVKSYG
jgi:hypothetical protein